MRAAPSSRFFNGTMTASQMKDAYKKLVKQYHPDLNGGKDNPEIRIITSEYAYWYARAATQEVKEEKKQNKPESAQYYDDHYDTIFVQSLEEMIKWIYENNIDLIDSVTVELIGVFIWIGGVTRDMRDVQIKIGAAGFRGSWKDTFAGEKVYMWKWTPELKRFKADNNIDRIRANHGTSDKKRYGNKPSYKRLNG